MRGPARLATYLAIGMIVAGFVVIFAAWNGAAELDRIPGQFPYLLSGGLAGLGFIISGTAVLVVQAFRTATAERSRRMAELQRHMDGLLGVLGTPPAAPQTPPAVGAATVQPAAAAAQPATATLQPDAAGAQPAAAPAVVTVIEREPTVVAGRSSFHTPDCRIVAGRDDLDRLPRSAADANALAPCRICNP